MNLAPTPVAPVQKQRNPFKDDDTVSVMPRSYPLGHRPALRRGSLQRPGVIRSAYAQPIRRLPRKPVHRSANPAPRHQSTVIDRPQQIAHHGNRNRADRPRVHVKKAEILAALKEAIE